MSRYRRARRHDQAAIRSAGEACDRALDFAGIARIDRPQLHAERLRHGLNSAELSDAGWIGGIAKESCSHKPRRDLFQQLQPFPAHAVFEDHEPGDIAAWPRSSVSTKPAPTGSETPANTMGEVRVRRRNASTANVPLARMMSGPNASNSLAYVRSSSTSFSPQRVSMRTLRPSVQPNCCNACRNAATCA